MANSKPDPQGQGQQARCETQPVEEGVRGSTWHGTRGTQCKTCRPAVGEEVSLWDYEGFGPGHESKILG